MLLIGIDWASDHHDVLCIDESGVRITDFRVPMDREGVQILRDRLATLAQKVGGRDQLLIGIETCRLLLVDLLLNDGYIIYPLSPKAIDRYRDRYSASGAKSDRFDAELIANALRTDRHRFRVLQPDSPLLRELRILVHDQQRLIRTRTRFLNQLQAALRDYYPALLAAFEDFDSPSALAFLARYPQPTKPPVKAIGRLLRQHRHPHPDTKAQQIVQALDSSRLPVDDFTVRAKSRLVVTLVEQLQTLRARLADYEDEIAALFERHPDAPMINSLPGSGPHNGPRLLVELGDQRQRYSSPDQLPCEAGTCPVTYSSGKSRWVAMRRACRPSFRDTIHQFTFNSLPRSAWAKSYYQDLRNRGKAHSAALRSVADKWLKIIYRLWQDRLSYNENTFLAARMRCHLQASGVAS